MASPFPGMDPYLEGEMWQEFHETLASAIRQQLMPHLKPKYVALLAKRYVIDRPTLGIIQPPDRIVYPDVHVVRPPGPAAPLRGRGDSTAFMEPTVVLPSLTLDEIPLLSVEIRDVAQRRLVTVIEILSPVNKWSEGAREYTNRRLGLLQTDTHLLEIDLLCQGQRVPLRGQPPPAPYYIYLSRANRRPYTLVWALTLRNPLPRIPVPLLQPDPDVVLDLQAALDACFELVGYENLLDYTVAPPAGHTPEDIEWINAVLSKAHTNAR